MLLRLVKNLFLNTFDLVFIMNKKFFINILLAILLIILLFLSISSFKNKSITLDEEKYIKAGRVVYEEFSFDSGLMILHPPLTYYIQGLSRLIFPSETLKQELFYARLMMQPLLLLFGLMVFSVAKKRYGVFGGLFAFTLFVFNNEILTHGRLIDIDLALAFFIFLSLITFYKFLNKPDWQKTLLAGLSLGLAFLTKYNALLLIPIFIITLVFYFIFKERKLKTSILGKFAILIIIAFFCIHLGYLLKGSLQLPEKFDSQLSEEQITAFLSLFLRFVKNKNEIRTISLDYGDEDNLGFLYSPPEHVYGQWVLVPRAEDWKEIHKYIKEKIEKEY